MLTPAQVNQFDRDGFVLVNNAFSQAEVDVLVRNIDSGGRVVANVNNMPDSAGRSSKLALWSELGNDVFAAVSASPRIVPSATVLLREEVYHWHSKVMLKEPKVGGAWEWHQDYGYWYIDGCMYPHMISCMVALDRATRENGCLKVLVGSHRIGRINHGKAGTQNGADPERVAAAEKQHPVHYVEAEPGSALFFHCNLLHASEANTSDRPRRAFICCYNAFSNVPFVRHHGLPVPIQLAPDDAILTAGKA